MVSADPLLMSDERRAIHTARGAAAVRRSAMITADAVCQLSPTDRLIAFCDPVRLLGL